MAHSNSQLATEFECLLLTKKVVPNSSVAVSQLLVAWYFVFRFYFLRKSSFMFSCYPEKDKKIIKRKMWKLWQQAL